MCVNANVFGKKEVLKCLHPAAVFRDQEVILDPHSDNLVGNVDPWLNGDHRPGLQRAVIITDVMSIETEVVAQTVDEMFAEAGFFHYSEGLRVEIPEEVEPSHEASGFAILPPAAAKRHKPGEIPFTIRNWDSRVTAYFHLADRLGLRQFGVWLPAGIAERQQVLVHWAHHVLVDLTLAVAAIAGHIGDELEKIHSFKYKMQNRFVTNLGIAYA